MNPALFGKTLPYDPVKDFAPISLVARVPNVIAVSPQKLPVKSLAELVELAKEQPGKLNYGTAGNDSAGHIAMEYFKSVAKIDIQSVRYKGTGPVVTDLPGGQIEMTFNGIPPIVDDGGILVGGTPAESYTAHCATDAPTCSHAAERYESGNGNEGGSYENSRCSPTRRTRRWLLNSMGTGLGE